MKWRKTDDDYYVMKLPGGLHLEAERFCYVWRWQLKCGDIVLAYYPIDDAKFKTAKECKKAAVEFARQYFADLLKSVS